MMDLVADLSPLLFLLCFVYSVLVHPLDLLCSIFIVHHSSEIYASREPFPHSFMEFWARPFKKVDFFGALATSMYGLLLLVLALVGFVFLSGNFFLFFYPNPYDVLFKIPFLALFARPFIVMFVKYMEWSAICNMGMVVSILEAKHGDIGVGVAAYYSRGFRTRGFFLSVVVSTWRVSLRLICLYLVVGKGWNGLGWTAAQVFGVGLGNLVKWVVFVVFFCDCKKRFLEKKVDVEDGRAVDN